MNITSTSTHFPSTNFSKITFIGGGNMARSLLGGLLNKNFPSENLRVIEPHEHTAHALHLDFGITTYAQLQPELIKTDYVILAIKPQMLKSVCEDLGKHWRHSSALLISIAAGIRTQSIATWLHAHSQTTARVIRAMPNTPALIGLGATGLFSPQALESETRQTIETIFSAIGISVWLEEETQLDTVTALSGSGPAYFFHMLEALIEAGIDEGLSPEQSAQLVVQTAVGAAHMALNTLSENSDVNIAGLRERVTSKGGTTEAGLASLHHSHFSHMVKQAVTAAKRRSIELSDEHAD